MQVNLCLRASSSALSVVSGSFATAWTVALQAPPSMGFPRQEYWIGLPFPSPEALPKPGIEPTRGGLAGRAHAARAGGRLPSAQGQCTPPEQPLLSFYTVCGLEMNVDVLWALTFLGQCGVCGLDLLLTWAGTGRRGHGRTGGQGRGAPLLRKSCLRVCVCGIMPDRGGSKPGRRA